MPLDSRQKRASALGFWNAAGPLPLADGNNANTVARRAMLLFQYSGTVPSGVVVAIGKIINTIGVWSPIVRTVGVWDTMVNSAGRWTPIVRTRGKG